MFHISTFLLYIGILFIAIGYVNQIKKTTPIIEYRYIPQTFEEQQENPIKVGKIFKDLFEKPDVYLAGKHIGTDEFSRSPTRS
jgi:hypothetical protein